MSRISLRLILLLAFLASLASASAPTFCKCTCFKNSTIIPLGPNQPHSPASPPSAKPSTLDIRAGPSPSCAQCNRAACLSYNLPFCKDAEEKDVVAMCFQRDSRKDQIIVWAFLLGTTGLLGWALVRRVGEVKGFTQGGLNRGVAGLGIGGMAGGEGAGGGLSGVGGLFQRRGTGEQERDEGARGAYSSVGTS